MNAKYAGKCRYCGHHYPAGTEIIKDGNRWVVKNCPHCAQRQQDIERIRALETRMIERHNILCGYDFGNQGYQETSTRLEFIDAAVRLGEATPEDKEIWFRYWGSWSLWKDLAD